MSAFWHAFTPKLIIVWREGNIGRFWRSDALAGLTVAIVALPLAMALGIASGASPNQGLVTAVIAGFLISLLGGSRVQIGGPTGAFVVIVAGVIAAHGYAGLILATLLAGFILIAAGYAGVGRLVRFIPMPVITGFTAGIAVIIASSQVGDFLGLTTGNVPANFIPKWTVYFSALGSISGYAVAIGSATLAGILLLRRFAPQLPAFLISLLIASLAAGLLHLPVVTVGDRFPAMPTGIPAPHLPSVSLALIQQLWPSAFTIAFLAGLESLLSATVADGMTGYNHRPGQELVAQGVANIGSAIFGGMPATGAIARTATNIRAGARTPLAGMFHAGFLLIFLLVAGKFIAHVPMAALAAILLVVAWGMAELDRFKSLLKMDAGDRALLLLTFGLTVLVDLTVAIGVGVTLASLLFLARMSETAGLLPEELSIDDPAQRASLPKGVEVFRFAGPMFFGVARDMLDALRRSGRRPKFIILRMEQVPYIDSSGASALDAFMRQARHEGTQLILCDLRQQPSAFLAKLEPPFLGAARAATFQAALDQVIIF
ncbi:MAG TPA: SulP family inorganic anion transporter [Steroidobacteraceae bacterium]|jgi:SulP family sulfate permease|nr:SulP family inorganic anion transporter [Steroidobacteraceae bacterium]